MKALKYAIFTGVFGVLISSCYKYPDVTIYNDDLDLTLTLADDQHDFKQYVTFTVEDTIRKVVIVNGGTSESDTILDMATANYITAELIKKMKNYGYTYVPSTTGADLQLVGHVIDNTSEGSGVECYPGYWYGYGGWGYPSYGGGYYPYYPSYGGCYGYEYFNRKGTIIVDMFDLKNFVPGPSAQIHVPWFGAIVAALGESKSSNVNSRLDRGISEMFDQSKYLDNTAN